MLSNFLCIQLFVTLWTVARQSPLSMGFSRQEYWGGLPCPPPGDLPDPGIKPMSLTSPALACGFFLTSGLLSNQSSFIEYHQIFIGWNHQAKALPYVPKVNLLLVQQRFQFR